MAIIVFIFNWRGRTGEQRDQRKRRGRRLRPMRLISWIESSLGFIVRRSYVGAMEEQREGLGQR